MKGLLKKELYVLKSTRMIALIIIYAAALVISLVLKMVSLTYLMHVLLLIAPVIAASKDERYGWSDFAKALPVSTAKRVGARYIVCVSELLVLDFFTLIICELLNASSHIAIINYIVQMFFIGALALSVVMFLCYKFRRGARIVATIITISAFSWAVSSAALFGGVSAIYALEPWFAAVSAVSGVALLGVSYMLSVRAQTAKAERRPVMRKTLSASLCALAVAACVCTCVLGVRGRLVTEPIFDIEYFATYSSKQYNEMKLFRLFKHNIRKRSNQQVLSNIEMYDALRKLAGKKTVSSSVEETSAVLEKAGFKASRDIGFFIDLAEMTYSSKYDTLSGYRFSDGSFALNSCCPSKYVPVNDNSEMTFDDTSFEKGMNELEFLNRMEEKDIPIYSMREEEYCAGRSERYYFSYISYENVNTKEVLFSGLTFNFVNGKLESFTAENYYNEYEVDEDDIFADEVDTKITTARENMMLYARTFNDGAYAGGDIDVCRQYLNEIGALHYDDGVFEGYIFGNDNLDITLVESSAYPGIVDLMKISGYTGENYYETMSEKELGALKSIFRVGMSDLELVDLLEEKELYPSAITENVDRTFTPEKIYKCYQIPLTFGVYSDTEEVDKDCEIRVELYNGRLTNVLVYLDGLIDPEPTVQYIQLSEKHDVMVDGIDAEYMLLPDFVNAFEQMCAKPLSSVAADDDTVLFETYKWANYIGFSLVRQVPNGYNDEFYQLRMEVCYHYDETIHSGEDITEWGNSNDAEFFEKVRKSAIYNSLKTAQEVWVSYSIEST